MRFFQYPLLLILFGLVMACSDTAPQKENELPTNEQLKQATTIDGVGGETKSMAVGDLTLTFAEHALADASRVVLFLDGEEVASSTNAPFTLEGINTRDFEDGSYTMRLLVTYADGSEREVVYPIQISNVLLRLNNNLFDLRSDHADDYGDRVAIADKEGNVLDWQDVREEGTYVFYAPEGFYDESIAMYAIYGSEIDDVAWLAYAGIPRGMSWSNALGEEKGRYADYSQQQGVDLQIACASNCPNEGTLFFHAGEWASSRQNTSFISWPLTASLRVNKIDQYVVGGVQQAGEARYGYVNLAETGGRTFDLSQFQAYQAQWQELSDEAFQADVQLRFAPDQRLPVYLSESYKDENDPNAANAGYLLPKNSDVEEYMVKAGWDAGKTNAFGMGSYIGATVFNEPLSAPRPISALEVSNIDFRGRVIRPTDASKANFTSYFWFDDGESNYYREYFMVEFAGEHFEPIRLEQIFEGTEAEVFENVVLEDMELYYLPDMTNQQYLEMQKDSAYPLVGDEFFYGLPEVRWYGQSLYHTSAEGRLKSRREPKLASSLLNGRK